VVRVQGELPGCARRLRVTFGLRKRDGAWQITYEHESMPFYMDDFRAATGLEP
jgi:ketosteroid isomerase-like protein